MAIEVHTDFKNDNLIVINFIEQHKDSYDKEWKDIKREVQTIRQQSVDIPVVIKLYKKSTPMISFGNAPT